MTLVEVDEQARTVTTTFADGARLTASPSMDAENVARARALGYRGSDGDVVWAMTRDHDPLHTVLTEAQGWDTSMTLWMAAHPAVVATGEVRLEMEREERTVLLIQRLMNVGLAPVLAERAVSDGPKGRRR